MSNLEFVLSLTPEQILKLIEFNKFKDFNIGVLYAPETNLYDLHIYERLEDFIFRGRYQWVNDKWVEEEMSRSNNLQLSL